MVMIVWGVGGGGWCKAVMVLGWLMLCKGCEIVEDGSV